MLPAMETRPSSVNPWLLIFFGATLFFALVGFLLYRWSLTRNDSGQIAAQLIKRQNTVLAYDAMSIAREVAHLIENASRDVQVLSLVAPTRGNFMKFYLSHISSVTRSDPRDESTDMVPLPLYNELIALNSSGDETLRLRNGRFEPHLRRRSQCAYYNLCDPKLIEEGMKLPVGELLFGHVLRYYTPEREPQFSDEGTLPVLYRSSDGLVILGIDYRYFREILMEPVFPYERKRNLLQAYQNGNYIYLIDDRMDFLAHPKPWHVAGIDKKTGLPVPPMKTDADEGTHPLNVAAYQTGKIKTLLDRLAKKSLVQNAVDIFEAPNLTGTTRVLSVAPIPLTKGQYRQMGVFGHVVIGCSVDYFEEPKEQYVPYY